MKKSRQHIPRDGNRLEPSPPAPRRTVNGRELAFFALKEFEDSGAYLSTTIDRLSAAPLTGPDRGLAMELSYGVVRRVLALDAVLRQVVSRPRESVEDDLWTILRLGAMQLLLMPGLPVHAAVHETVELAKRVGQPRWTGIVNGVLRAITRMRTEDVLDAPTSSTIPLVTVSPASESTEDGCVQIHYLKLEKEAFPDPATDPMGYASEAFSIPRWLLERLESGASNADRLRIAAWFATSGVTSLRVNPRHCDREQLLAALQGAGIAAFPGRWPESVRLATTTRIDTLPGFLEGWFSVQDESAMAVVDLLAPQPGESILDLCSAPGGKTMHMAERMNDVGRIVACDVGWRRLKSVKESSDRLGLSCVETRLIAADGDGLPEETFDAVLVDAPCSNTGVLGKRPEVRWRLTPADFEELRQLQRQLLRTAAGRVRPGGRLVYSTCSIDSTENAELLRGFLAESPGFALLEERTASPGRPGDGGYAALLRRDAPR